MSLFQIKSNIYLFYQYLWEDQQQEAAQCHQLPKIHLRHCKEHFFWGKVICACVFLFFFELENSAVFNLHSGFRGCSSTRHHSPNSHCNSEVINQSKVDNLLVEMCQKSIRKCLVAPTSAGMSVHHLDNSFNSKVLGIVLAKRKKSMTWRSLRHFSRGVMCQSDYCLVKSLKSPFKEVDTDKGNTEMQGRLRSHLEALIT